MNGAENRKPAIWTDALQLATSIEQAVRGFPRYHKYALGSDLRQAAQAVSESGPLHHGGQQRVLRRLLWAHQHALLTP